MVNGALKYDREVRPLPEAVAGRHPCVEKCFTVENSVRRGNAMMHRIERHDRTILPRRLGSRGRSVAGRTFLAGVAGNRVHRHLYALNAQSRSAAA